MIIRTETTADYSKVFQVNYEAFRNREDEPKLVEKIRKSEQFIPELSIIAEENDEIFMVCELIDGELDRIQGELRYPETFF